LLEAFPDVALVSISDAQRAPIPFADFRATIHHGMPRDLVRFEPRSGDYLAFLGRLAPEKGLERAIEIAIRTGSKLKIAARVLPEERAYYAETIAPALERAGALAELVGEVGGAKKEAFLRGARALLFPIDWPEPFGLVMIEALSAGTPVVAWRNGSVEEIIANGLTGFVVDDIEQAVAAVGWLGAIDRATCRRAFERRFGVERMARDYLRVYRELAGVRPAPRPTPAVSRLAPARLEAGTR